MHPKADKWRKIADSLRAQAGRKLNPATASQRYTPRRARIMASMASEGFALKRAADLADRIAGCWTKLGRLPYPLGLIGSGKDALTIANGMTPEGMTEAQADMARAAIGTQPEDDQERKLRDALAEIRRGARDIPGFFPTPPKIVDLMIDCADIGPDVRRVLEPSAGIGSILDRLGERHPEIEEVLAFEVQRRLYDVLNLKRFSFRRFACHCHDFMEVPVPEEPEDFYDVILMNPPFERGQDSDHVLHALHMLRPGGRLVAIVSEGLFFREDRKAETFRLAYHELRGFDYPLPEGAFNGPDAFVPTGVRTRIVVLDRPKA